jgi:hypothetical protein
MRKYFLRLNKRLTREFGGQPSQLHRLPATSWIPGKTPVTPGKLKQKRRFFVRGLPTWFAYSQPFLGPDLGPFEKTPLARAEKWVAAGSIYWENGCRNVGTPSLEPESRRRFESGLRHRIKVARRVSLQSPRQKEWPLPCCSSHIAADLDTLSITCSTEGHPALFASTA